MASDEDKVYMPPTSSLELWQKKNWVLEINGKINQLKYSPFPEPDICVLGNIPNRYIQVFALLQSEQHSSIGLLYMLIVLLQFTAIQAGETTGFSN